MRTIGKLLGSLFAAALVVGIFSMTVMADPALVDSGTTGWYDYELYSDGELKIIMHDDANSCVIDFSYIGEANLATVKSVTIDVTATTKEYLYFEGTDCKADKIYIVSTDGCKQFPYAAFEEFPLITPEDIYFPEDSLVEVIGFYYMDFENESIDLRNNNYKSEICFFRGCSNISGVILPDQAGFEFHLSNCGTVNSLTIPASITAFHDDSFWKTKITNIYYSGSNKQFDNIKTIVYDFDIDDYVLTEAPFKSKFGDATIHYFYGITSDWVQDGEGDWYYLDENSDIVTGWNKIDGAWYYFDEDGIMMKNWQKINERWYFLGSNGAMRTGWQKISNDWYYLGTDGAMSKNWRNVDGKWYYFGDSGVMRTGWWQLDGSWYYLKASGEMATGWVSSGGYWYYMNNSGVMLKNWQQIEGTWYYLGNSGAMVTDWQKINGRFYYFTSSGAMKTGWLQLGNTWYYLDPESGAMVTGKQTIGGKEYTFDDETGVWVA